MQEMWIWSLGQEDPQEKEMADHSSILAWVIPWIEEPDRLQSMGSNRVGQDLKQLNNNKVKFSATFLRTVYLEWSGYIFLIYHLQLIRM